MMSTNNKYAGRIVKLKKNKPDFQDISMEMSYYLKNKSQITVDGNLALKAANKFNLEVCSNEYINFFKKFI